MSDHDRVTLAHLADELGLTKMSISRALNGAPGVSEATRKKVRDLAQKRNYVPDPAISTAMSRMRSHRTVTHTEIIAWLSSHRSPGGWRKNFMLSEMFRGATDQAARLGYQLEEFCLNEKNMSPKRLGNILYNRGIRGLIVAPLEEHGAIEDFPWKHFSAVTCGHSLTAPCLHRVASDQFQVVRVAWETLVARGYQRIGLCVSKTDNERVNNLWLGSHLGWQRALTPGSAIPPMVTDKWNSVVFLEWFESHQPDVILSYPEVYQWMRGAHKKTLENCGFALLNYDGHQRLSGVDHRFEHQGAAAVSAVAGELTANQYGVPEARKSIFMESVWRDGGTESDQSEASTTSDSSPTEKNLNHLIAS